MSMCNGLKFYFLNWIINNKSTLWCSNRIRSIESKSWRATILPGFLSSLGEWLSPRQLGTQVKMLSTWYPEILVGLEYKWELASWILQIISQQGIPSFFDDLEKQDNENNYRLRLDLRDPLVPQTRVIVMWPWPQPSLEVWQRIHQLFARENMTAVD